MEREISACFQVGYKQDVRLFLKALIKVALICEHWCREGTRARCSASSSPPPAGSSAAWVERSAPSSGASRSWHQRRPPPPAVTLVRRECSGFALSPFHTHGFLPSVLVEVRHR
ncbi:hypothetical protein SRHO_G00307650 [Serrasalmus rhombeus]